THVLDTHGGHPAAGVAIELCEVAASGVTRLIKRAATNADGRTDQPLLSGMPVPIATYELRLAVSDYFARQGVPMAHPPLLGPVPFCGGRAGGPLSRAALGPALGLRTYRGSGDPSRAWLVCSLYGCFIGILSRAPNPPAMLASRQLPIVLAVLACAVWNAAAV